MQRLLIILIAIILLSSCTNDPNKDNINTGSINITVDNCFSRTIKPSNNDITVTSYKLVGSMDDNSINKPFTSSSLFIEKILSGNWTFHIEGYNEQGILIAISPEKTVKINPKSTTNASFFLDYLKDGKGLLNIQIKIPSTNEFVNKIIVTISNNSTSKDIILRKSNELKENGYFLINSKVEVPTGNYKVLISTFQDDVLIGRTYRESLFIYKNITSNYDFMISEVGKTVSPVISPTNNYIEVGELISLSCATKDSVIYFSTDDNISAIDGNLYEGPFPISKNTTIKAIACSVNNYCSDEIVFDYHIKSSIPTVNKTSGVYDSPIELLLSILEENGKIYYTLDGSTPTTESSLFEKPISINHNCILKAINVVDERDPSDVVEIPYSIRTQSPSISTRIQGAKVGITLAGDKDATIYYTLDGLDPLSSETRKKYEEEFFIENTSILKTVALKNNYENSNIITQEINVLPQLSKASYSINEGVYSEGQIVTLQAQDNAIIMYSTDGINYNIYTTPLSLNQNTSLYSYVKKDGFFNSDIEVVNYQIRVAKPIFSIEPGLYNTSQTVSITSNTPNSIIYYTLDGSTPSDTSTIYSSPILVSTSKTIKSIAIKENLVSSEINEAKYEIGGKLNVSITNPPSLYDVKIIVPYNWTLDKNVVPDVAAVLKCEITPKPTSSSVSYEWYCDGEKVGTDDKLVLGTNALRLKTGSHNIECIIKINSNYYCASYQVGVSNSATIGTSGPMYAVGMNGPTGGLVFYDCDEDNTLDDSDGPDNLISTQCGWQFLEASNRTLGTVQFGFNIRNGLYIKDGETYPSIGKGLENTNNIVSAIGEAASSLNGIKIYDYAAKIVYDYSETLSDGHIVSDWFLPSTEELAALSKLKTNVGSWSSYIWDSTKAYFFISGHASLSDERMSYKYCIPVRRFKINEPYGHIYTSEVIQEATCTEGGEIRYTCTICGDNYVEYVFPHHYATISIGSVSYCNSCGKAVYGPAGGYIFYDCDEDNNFGNNDSITSEQVGWKYIEALPFDLFYSTTTASAGSFGDIKDFYFGSSGEAEKDEDGDSLFYHTFVNGTNNYNEDNCTKTTIGSGKQNTNLIFSSVGTSSFYNYSKNDKPLYTDKYASKIVKLLTYNNYSDWFVPSKDELNQIYNKLKVQGVSDFCDTYYWSSSEDPNNMNKGWAQNFNDGQQSLDYLSGPLSAYHIRPIRYVNI